MRVPAVVPHRRQKPLLESIAAHGMEQNRHPTEAPPGSGGTVRKHGLAGGNAPQGRCTASPSTHSMTAGVTASSKLCSRSGMSNAVLVALMGEKNAMHLVRGLQKPTQVPPLSPGGSCSAASGSRMPQRSSAQHAAPSAASIAWSRARVSGRGSVASRLLRAHTAAAQTWAASLGEQAPGREWRALSRRGTRGVSSHLELSASLRRATAAWRMSLAASGVVGVASAFSTCAGRTRLASRPSRGGQDGADKGAGWLKSQIAAHKVEKVVLLRCWLKVWHRQVAHNGLDIKATVHEVC
jgi:hypothetical protein